jgi:hypothetical protein
VIWVVDASAAVELLLRTSIGLRIDPIVFRDRTLAPELLDAEVLAVIRREHLHGRLDGVRAREAIDDAHRGRAALSRVRDRGGRAERQIALSGRPAGCRSGYAYGRSHAVPPALAGLLALPAGGAC